MVRKVLGVIVGYVALFAFVALTFWVASAALGMDGTYRPGTWEASALWLAVSFPLGFGGAVLGGLVCMRIARSRRTAAVFAAIVFVVGLAFGVASLVSDAPVEARPADASPADAAGKARQPVWVSLLNPFVGAAGILLGSRLRREGEAVS